MQVRIAELPSTRGFELGRDCGYFPVVAAAGGSAVVIVWRAGAGHMGITGRLEAVRSDDGEHWSQPAVVAQSDWDDRNPAVGVTPGGVIVVAYHGNGCYSGESQYEPALGRLRTRLTRSRDGGRTWDPPYGLNLPEFDGLSPYGQMLALADGSLLLPIYGSLTWKTDCGAPSSSFLLRSADEGATWGLYSRVGDGINESAFLALEGGAMLAAVRSDGRDARLLAARSEDSGRHWSPPQELTAPQQHPGCLTALSGGTILLTYGHRQKPFGARGLLSFDGGRSWQRDKEIAFCDSADNWDCGYPSTAQLCDGRLVTAFYATSGQADAWSWRGARCHVLVYREAELLAAVGRA